MATLELTLREALGFCAQHGFDGLEVTVQHGYRCGIGEDAAESVGSRS